MPYDHLQKTCQFETLEPRQLFAVDLVGGAAVDECPVEPDTATEPAYQAPTSLNSAPFQNPDNQFDVNDDGTVTEQDARLVIGRINSVGIGKLPETREDSSPYYDVNGDGTLTAIDVLLVRNELTRPSLEPPSGVEPSPSPHQNSQERLDVNNDGVISAIDALLIINELQRNGPHRLSEPALPYDGPYVDVNGDRYVSAVDLLHLTNYLNQETAGQQPLSRPPAEEPAANSSDQATLDEALTDTVDWELDLRADLRLADFVATEEFSRRAPSF